MIRLGEASPEEARSMPVRGGSLARCALNVTGFCRPFGAMTEHTGSDANELQEIRSGDARFLSKVATVGEEMR
jgi:hypothetical protein